MINILICDDEELFVKKISSIIDNFFARKGISINIDTCNSGEELLSDINKKLQYNIYILDIEMGKTSGINVAKRIRELSDKPHIVFVTSFLDYAPEGYCVNAIRYILKTKDGLEKSVEECMGAIIEKINQSMLKLKMEFVEGNKYVYINKLLYIESKLHKLEFHILENDDDNIKIYTKYSTLNNIEKDFQFSGFLRIHQSFYVNMRYVENIVYVDGRYFARMMDGLMICIPRKRCEYVKMMFVEYKGAF